MKKKKASFSFVFLVLRGERCKNGKRKGFFNLIEVLTVKQLEEIRGRRRVQGREGEGRGGEKIVK